MEQVKGILPADLWGITEEFCTKFRLA